MANVRLICPCGHTWEHPRSEPVPADVREICPACSATKVSRNPAPKRETPPPPPAPAVGSTIVQSAAEQSKSAAESVLGRTVAGFEILEEINRGGMGIIYKARQVALNRLVAVKAITPAKLESPGVRARFMREVRAAARLNHPNIVTVFHTDLDGPFPYLAMEYVPGIDLLRLVRKFGTLPVPDAIYYIRQAAEGLQHAYEQGLVHRDIKPSNLIVTPGPIGSDGQKSGKLPKVKILDMGLARVVAPEAKEPDEFTPVGIFLGSPDYVSPEQAEDARQADHRSDIYSLGGSLYFLLTGEVPFPGKSLMDKLRKAVTEPTPSAMAKRKDVPAKLDAVIRKMLSKNPIDRFQKPGDVIAALDRVTRAEGLGGPGADEPEEPEFTPQVQVKGHAGAVRGLAVNADGQFLVTAGDDSKMKIWEPSSLTETRGFVADLGAVGQLVIAAGGKWGATCCDRLTTAEIGIQLWDLSTGAERKRLRGPADNIRCVAISPDGKSIVAGAEDSMVWVWLTDPAGPKTFCMKGHAGAVTGIAFVSADSLLTAGSDGTVRQWDLRTGKAKGVLSAGVGPIGALAYGGKRVAAAGQALAVRMPTGAFTKLVGHDGGVNCCACSPDGRVLLSGGADRTVRLWSAEDASELAVITGFDSGIRTIAFDPAGKAFFTGTDAGTLARWTVPGA